MVLRSYGCEWKLQHRRGQKHCKPSSSHMEMADNSWREKGKACFNQTGYQAAGEIAAAAAELAAEAGKLSSAGDAVVAEGH